MIQFFTIESQYELALKTEIPGGKRIFSLVFSTCSTNYFCVKEKLQANWGPGTDYENFIAAGVSMGCNSPHRNVFLIEVAAPGAGPRRALG